MEQERERGQVVEDRDREKGRQRDRNTLDLLVRDHLSLMTAQLSLIFGAVLIAGIFLCAIIKLTARCTL